MSSVSLSTLFDGCPIRVRRRGGVILWLGC